MIFRSDVHIVQWSATERKIGPAESSGFFDKPLEQPWLFNFTTSSLKLAPHAGAFSLKAVLRGEEIYVFGNRRVRLRPGRLMFVPAGREYASSITDQTTSLSIFLPTEHCISFWRGIGGYHEEALEGGPITPKMPLPVAWRASRKAWARFQCLSQSLASGAQGAAEEAYSFMAEAGECWLRMAPTREPFRRPSTNEELLSRVLRAREMIEDQGGVDCSLDGLAEASCLSRYHLLRVFKDFYGCTPGDYSRDVRLQRSSELLEAGINVHDAARQSGYSRASSLHRARRRGGLP